MFNEDDKNIKAHPTKLKVSILADSVSTFGEGYSTDERGNRWAPSDCIYNYPNNRVRYPDTNLGVTNVSQMWWQIILDHFDWQLGINESWAGSRIAWTGEYNGTHYGEDIHIASMTRIKHLDKNGTPDIIMVLGGINDINHLDINKLGTLSPTDPSTYTDKEIRNLPVDTFYDAVTALILRLRYYYPNAQILYILPYFVTKRYRTTPYTQKQFHDAAIEVCDYLGIDYIDLRKVVNVCNISALVGDDLHPNSEGMEIIAKSIIKKLEYIIN